MHRWLPLLLVLMTSACGPITAAPSASQSSGAPVAVHAAAAGTIGEAGQYLALERGYFAQESLEVNFERVTSDDQLIPTLGNGQLDVGGGNSGAAVFNAIARGVGLRIVAPQMRQDPGASGLAIVARKDLIDSGRLNSYASLKGLRIAVRNPAKYPPYNIHKLLESGGLAATDIELTSLDFPQMEGALANKAIDLAAMPEPQATAAVEHGAGVKWKFSGDYAPGHQNTVVLFSPKLVANHDLGVHWMTAYLRGVRDYNNAFFRNVGRSEVVDQLTKQLTVKDPALYDKMAFGVADPNGKLNVASLQDQLDYAIQTGEVTTSVNLTKAIDTSFVEGALAKLGPYNG